MTQLKKVETPETVHGRLLESVHISGYSFERACGELEWLLDDDRWKAVGGGQTDINAFLATIDFSEFRIALEQRKKLAKRLQAIEASQRATARLLGVDKETVARDVGKRDGANAPREALEVIEHTANAFVPTTDGANAPLQSSQAWFQSDADPSKEAKRVTRNQEREEDRQLKREERPARALPAGKYRLIYADPPWRYEHIETENRAIENQYPTMSLEDICALPVPAADDAVLFLWATSPKVAEAIQVIDRWGFSYRTCAVWDKEKIGMGYYFRQQHELLLVAARGALPVPEPSARVSSVIRVRRGGIHSRKPVQVIELLESMYPTFGKADRIELFTREPRAGWSFWGNESAVAS